MANLLTDCTEVVINPEYDSCYGFIEGNSELDNSWSSLSKIEESNNWDSLYLSMINYGTIDINQIIDSNYSVALNFKAGNQYSTYFWDSNFTYDSISFITEGSELSHAELFIKENSVPVPEGSTIVSSFIAFIIFILFYFKKRDLIKK